MVPSQVKLAPISEGLLKVSGAPGAIVGENVTTVTLSVWRMQVAPTTYRVNHVGTHLAIASSYSPVAPDGSFKEVTLGAADRPIQSGDELVLTPQAGTSQAGPPVTIVIP